MVDSVAVCGDSFGCGSGMPLSTCYEDSFGGQLSKELNLPLKVFARSGCCNFVIYLQVKKIVEQFLIKKINPLVVITLTHHSRITFPLDGKIFSTEIDLKSVDYQSYTPYSEYSNPRRLMEFESDKLPNHLSETISNMNLCLSGIGHLKSTREFQKVMERKWKALAMYFEEIYDDAIKREYDTSIALMMHAILKEHHIPHIIMGSGRHTYRHIDEKNWLDIHWGQLSQAHPDEGGSGHCNKIGHTLVANALLPKCINAIS